MIYKIKDSKGSVKVCIAENKNINKNNISYYITNEDGEGIEIQADKLVNYLKEIIDKEI